jgi:perosamine synthetase
VAPLLTRPDRSNAHHLYVIRLVPERLAVDRRRAFQHLRERGIGANVHYAPVYLHTFYRDRLGFQAGLCPVAEAVYEQLLTLPMFPAMSDAEADRVIEAVSELKALR